MASFLGNIRQLIYEKKYENAVILCGKASVEGKQEASILSGGYLHNMASFFLRRVPGKREKMPVKWGLSQNGFVFGENLSKVVQE